MNPLADAAIAIAVLAVLYAGLCWLRPWTPCPVCDGTGLRGRGDAKRPRFDPCRWCHGHRLRLRWGRRIFNHFTRLRHESR